MIYILNKTNQTSVDVRVWLDHAGDSVRLYADRDGIPTCILALNQSSAGNLL